MLEAIAEKKELQLGNPELKKPHEIYGVEGAEKSVTLAAEERSGVKKKRKRCRVKEEKTPNESTMLVVNNAMMTVEKCSQGLAS